MQQQSGVSVGIYWLTFSRENEEAKKIAWIDALFGVYW